jgi:heat shock protein HtpX
MECFGSGAPELSEVATLTSPRQSVLVYDRIDANRRNTVLLAVLFAALSLPIIAMVTQYLMLWVAVFILGLTHMLWGDKWTLDVALVATIAVALIATVAYLQYHYASAFLIRNARARPVGRDQERELWQIVENLCIGAGLPQPRVYVTEVSAPNAFAAGLDPGCASLVVSRGLLMLLDRRELEGVIAHELSHIGNHDTRLGSILMAGLGVLRLPLVVVMGVFRFLFGIHPIVGAGALLYLGGGLAVVLAITLDLLVREPTVGALLLILVGLPFYVVLGAPVVGQIIRLAIWRQREFLADADAALLTRYPEGLARALVKIDATANPDARVGAATAHVYFVNPLPPNAVWWDRMFSTHPPVEERVALLVNMGSGIDSAVLDSAREAAARFLHNWRPPIAEEPASQTDATHIDRLAPVHADVESGVSRRIAGYRLAGPSTTLYESPDETSAELAHFEGGTLITVSGLEGDFLRVITTDESFGYVLRTAPMTPVEIPEPGGPGADPEVPGL